MDENAYLHEIFKHINAILWIQAQRPAGELPRLNGGLIEARQMAVDAAGKRTENNIAAYIEQQTAMMQKLMAEERFSKFPLPKKRIGLWKRISIRRALSKAIRAWPFCGWWHF